ncbi:heme-containing dehydratase [Penicillium longicatenatum]|uniref:heme-containing dehydratase n=1 Tax=Penicillium longicatenatum TaxID=1561947 RepID=UPI0025469CA0|nr:heme-containing dehydratase [Penicillium longicatenatum]KAJ5630258.1 heme-containing dehydratase [Penicillium longicatenatum]
MWGVKLSQDEPFVYSIFGLQYRDDKSTAEKDSMRQTFDALIDNKPIHIDRIIQENSITTNPGRTCVWLGYWKSRTDYLDWWMSQPVSQFWASLPLDAGMWREMMMPDASRTQYVVDKSGYWGCYRQRMDASTSDTFATHLGKDLEPCPAILTSPDRVSIRSERILMTQFPDNICFVVEGQDHSQITPGEKAYWFQNFHQSVQTWIKDLMSAEPDSGILDGRLCFDTDSGIFGNSTTKALNYNKKIQLFYFKDLRHMERIGRSNKGHVQLRERFMAAYGPGGEMCAGKIGLWVETTVLKAGEMECEYVGCLEGTGWMAWAGNRGFQTV